MLAEAKKKPEPKKPKKHPAAQPSANGMAEDVSDDASSDQETEDDGAKGSQEEADPNASVGNSGDVGQDEAGQSGEQADPSETESSDDTDNEDSDQSPSPSDDSDDQDSPAVGAGQGGVPTDDAGAPQVPMSAAAKEEMQRLNGALYSALYTNDKIAQAVLKGIIPTGQHKIESVARMATLLVTQINKQLHFVQDMPQLVLPFTRDVVAHVLDLATQVKKIQYTDQESTAALGTALEIIMRVCGVSKQQMTNLRQHVPRSALQQHLNNYQKSLQYTKGARASSPEPVMQKNPQAGQPPAGGAPPQGQPPQGQPPQGQAPSGQPQPQPGAPVVAAPGPGQSAPPGGMLSAAQAPQGG